MDKYTYSLIESHMRRCMSDSAHDCEHVYRVLGNALVIAQGEEVDYDVLIAACLLHDIGRPDQIADPGLCHAEVGSEKAYRFLCDNGFNETFGHRVMECIRTHRFRKGDQPQSVEAKILFDADKLDVVGAIGIARTLAYKGTVAEPLYTRLPDGTISDGSEEGAPSFFREYHYKLEKLYDRFYTAKGRELAMERRASAQSFYTDLLQEVSRFDYQSQLQEVLK